MNLILVCGSEFDLVLVLGSRVTFFLCGGAKLNVCGPKLTCFECDDQLTWFLCGDGRNELGFWMRASNCLVVV